MGFTGFGKGATAFFEELAVNNSRDWWLRNKARYDTEVREPLELLLEDLAAEFGEAKVFRPNRDTRFSKDKSPYKTNAAAVIQRGDGAATYLSLSAEGLQVGGGGYHLDRDQLARFRVAIDARRSGTALEEIADELRAHGADVTAHSILKTAPRGYSADNPRIGLLRMGGIIGIWAYPPRAWLYTAKVRDKVAEQWRALDPLNAWLVANVG